MADSVSEDTISKSSLKRPRPVISCFECRRKKLKCSRTLPCQQCLKIGKADVCSFQAGQEPETNVLGRAEPPEKRSRAESNDRPRANRHVDHAAAAWAPAASSPKTPQTGMGLIEQLQQRVTSLENVVGVSRRNIRQNGSHDAELEISLSHRTPAPSRPRQSMSSDVFPNAAAFLKSWLPSSGNPEPRIGKAATDLRQLHESLKRLHKRPPTSQKWQKESQILRLIPSQSVCRTLTEVYFDNLEHCFRILHRPTFDRQLSAFFSGSIPDGSQHFLPQLIGILAISSILGMRNECIEVGHSFNGELIYTSVEFIQDHLSKLQSKELHTVPALQTRMILLLLRWMRLDRMTDLWELSGLILRQALTMGLDSESKQSIGTRSVLEAELRRRLWMTVCEEDMMIAILCNMPCLVPDFDCHIPLNVNDVELEQDITPASRSFDVWTDSLCQVYLAQSIKQRLHACRDMQSASKESYEHVLEHTRSFEQYLQNLPAPLRFNHLGDSTSKAPARLMARMELDITMRRLLMQLYCPFFYANDVTDMFSEARAGFLQSCLMLTSYQDLFDPKYSDIGLERPQGYWDFFYNVYRHEMNQSYLALCLEIQRLAASSQPNIPVANHTFSAFRMPKYTKSSLIHSVRDILEPMIRRTSHLGSNLKDLAYLTVVFSSVNSSQYDANSLVEALEDLAASCKTQLERDGVPVARVAEVPESQGWTPSFDLDADWMSFPQLSTDLNDLGEMNFSFDPV